VGAPSGAMRAVTSMSELRPGYRAYLLGLWRVQATGQTVWRASLENAHTGERHGFPSLERLMDHLRMETGVQESGRREDDAA
jgi:hypothetical protein